MKSFAASQKSQLGSHVELSDQRNDAQDLHHKNASHVERGRSPSDAQDLSQISPAPVALQRTFGRGRIAVKHSAGRTRIDQLYQEGAARIRIPDHPGRTDLEAIIINTAGGVTGGDDLGWEAKAGPGTRLTVTTQACEKVYKSSGTDSHVNVNLTVGEGATLCWLPQETILFDQARLARTINADMDEGAQLLLVEPVIFGRKAMGESVHTGLWRDSWRIHHKGQLIHGEEVRLKGEIAQHLARNAVLHGFTALATLALVGNHAEAKLHGARALLATSETCIGGASFWSVDTMPKLIIRLRARDGYALRKGLIPLINHLAGDPGSTEQTSVPKIWSL